jgi:biopolymer transport protein TolQ
MGNFVNMFTSSGVISQIVIFVLFVMSAYAWAIMVVKYKRLWKIKQQATKFQELLNTKTVGEVLNMNLTPADNPLVRIIEAIKQECPVEQVQDGGKTLLRRSIPDNTILKDRIQSEIELILGMESSRADFLATTASVSPFLGLLGTVLGITQSFWEIGQQSTANITVIAPGLAEALITTIVGLLVAIPAAIGYNLVRSRISDLATELEYFSLRILVKLGKEIR